MLTNSPEVARIALSLSQFCHDKDAFKKGGMTGKKKTVPKRNVAFHKMGCWISSFDWQSDKFFPLKINSSTFQVSKRVSSRKNSIGFDFQRGVFFLCSKNLGKITPKMTTPLQLFFRKISSTFVNPLAWSYPNSPKWWNHQVAVVDESVDVSSTTEVPFLVDVWVDVNIELFTERGRSFVKKVTVGIPGNILILYPGI